MTDFATEIPVRETVANIAETDTIVISNLKVI